MGLWMAPLNITRKHDVRFDTIYGEAGAAPTITWCGGAQTNCSADAREARAVAKIHLSAAVQPRVQGYGRIRVRLVQPPFEMLLGCERRTSSFVMKRGAAGPDLDNA